MFKGGQLRLGMIPNYGVVYLLYKIYSESDEPRDIETEI